MSKPSNAGIVTDADGGRVIPESRRPDGSIRPAIKVRPGYMPPEDVPKYRIPLYRRKAVAAEAETKAAPEIPTRTCTIPGASLEAEPATSASSTAAKNAKRREARKKAAANSAEQTEAKAETKTEAASSTLPAAPAETASASAPAPASAPAEDRDKKIRGLKKKLKQAKELQTKRDGGENLLPEQIAKVSRISDLTRELESLGLGEDGEEKDR